MTNDKINQLETELKDMIYREEGYRIFWEKTGVCIVCQHKIAPTDFKDGNHECLAEIRLKAASLREKIGAEYKAISAKSARGFMSSVLED